jgi:hypothetical protein
MRDSYNKILRGQQEKKQAITWFFGVPIFGISFFLFYLWLLEISGLFS